MTEEQIAMGNTLLKAMVFPDMGEELRQEVQAIVGHPDFEQVVVYLEDAALIVQAHNLMSKQRVMNPLVRQVLGSRNKYFATIAGAQAARTGIAAYLKDRDEAMEVHHLANLAAIHDNLLNRKSGRIAVFSLVVAMLSAAFTLVAMLYSIGS